VNWFDFEVKRLEVKVTIRPSMVKNTLRILKIMRLFDRQDHRQPFQWRHTGRWFNIEDCL